MNRITREKMLMEFALIAEKRGTCSRGSAGAVISRGGRVIATGYNGPVSGSPHCSPQHCDTCNPCTRSVHAEANSLIFAARYGISVNGAEMYCTTAPCAHICAPLIINSGIIKVTYLTKFREMRGISQLQSRGVEVVQYEDL